MCILHPLFGFEGADDNLCGPMVKWSRRGPLTPQTGVRLSHGSPQLPLEVEEQNTVGAFNGEGPPVPIPNTEVKLASAENTCLETGRKDR